MVRRSLPTATRTVLAALALVAAGSLTGCGSSASSAVKKVTDEISSAASQAAASASSAASKALTSVKGAVTASGDVAAGPVSVGSDGKAQTTLTVTNPTTEKHDYTVSVSFEDAGGSLLDATAVSVDGVPGKGTATGVAKSNRSLDNAASAKVTAAVRH